jgi:enoyl-CoA hydratase
MTKPLPDLETILYEEPSPHVARIVLNRPDARNAQNTKLLYELNAAFDHAAQDDNIKVLILAGAGKDFSAGHDLHEDPRGVDYSPYRPVGTWCGFGCAGAEGHYSREKEIYVALAKDGVTLPNPPLPKCRANALRVV